MHVYIFIYIKAISWCVLTDSDKRAAVMTCIRICTYTHRNIHTYMNMYTCTYIHIYLIQRPYHDVCSLIPTKVLLSHPVYEYVYTYVFVYIHTRIYVCTHMSETVSWRLFFDSKNRIAFLSRAMYEYTFIHIHIYIYRDVQCYICIYIYL